MSADFRADIEAFARAANSMDELHPEGHPRHKFWFETAQFLRYVTSLDPRSSPVASRIWGFAELIATSYLDSLGAVDLDPPTVCSFGPGTELVLKTDEGVVYRLDHDPRQCAVNMSERELAIATGLVRWAANALEDSRLGASQFDPHDEFGL